MEDSLDLHDATLLSLAFDWSMSELRCLVRLVSSGSQTICIVFREVRLAKIPAGHPWGKSSSINSWVQAGIDAGVAVRIEMQSGDVIEVLAERFGIEA